MTEPITVVAALSAVMSDVQAVGKEGRNASQGFNFRGIDAVVNAVGPALRTHGVIVLPTVLDQRVESYQTKTGTAMKSVALTVQFTFVGPNGDTLACSAVGEASDAGDKATSKAHSVAFRTALLQALCIPTDEPDPDSYSHERAPTPQGMTAQQQTAIAGRVAGLTDEQKPILAAWWKTEKIVPLDHLSTYADAAKVLLKLDEIAPLDGPF